MQHIYAIADVHLGNHHAHAGQLRAGINDRCAHILDALDRVVSIVEADPHGVLVVCGDLFDKVRPAAPVLAATQQLLRRVPSYVIKGNHEANSDELGDHALGPLALVASIIERDTVIELDGVVLWCLPFRREHSTTWLATAFATCAALDQHQPAYPRVVALHLGIEDQRTAKFMQGKPDAVQITDLRKLCTKHHVDQVYAGNWHDQRRWQSEGLTVDQVGALVPTGWNNPGREGYGGLGVFGRTPEPELLQLAGPRFVKVFTSAEVDELRALPDSERSLLYVRAYVEPERVPEFTDRLAIGLGGVEVHTDATFQNVAAKRAAQRAVGADNIERALAGYVSAAPLQKGLAFSEAEQEREFRAEVLTVVHDLLRGSDE